MRKSEYIGYVIITCILAITAGIIIHVYSDAKLERASIKQVEEFNLFSNITANNHINESTIKETGTSEEKTTPNTVFVFETHYNKCGHSEIKKEKIENADVNKTKEELAKKYVGWNIKSFSSKEVYMYKEQENQCKNHYLVKEVDNKVVVYSIDQDGNEAVKNETEILTKYLPEEDIKLLKKGIMANNQTELEEILSDYE